MNHCKVRLFAVGALLTCASPLLAQNEHYSADKEWTYRLSTGNEATITSWEKFSWGGNDKDSVLHIPEHVDGYLVTAVAPVWEYQSRYNAATVVLPDSVTSIEDGAFMKNKELTEVIIGPNVTNIGKSAFIDCFVLRTVNIPDSVVNIGDDAFMNCYGLTNITIGNGVTNIRSRTFATPMRWLAPPGPSLSDVVIPDSVTNISESAFRSSGVVNVVIGRGVTNIGKSAFNSCDKLETISFGERVVQIGEEAFMGCSALKAIVIPDSVVSVQNWAFGKCAGVTNVTIGKGVLEIKGSAFRGCASLIKITIPDNVREIGTHAFQDCSSLTDVIIPDSVIKIGSGAFKGCDALTNVQIPSRFVAQLADLGFAADLSKELLLKEVRKQRLETFRPYTYAAVFTVALCALGLLGAWFKRHRNK
jgi:putative transposon-encoded protein